MSAPTELSALGTVLVSTFLLAGAAFTLIGALGLLRLPTFYMRLHAPTLGTTLGTVFISAASMLYFSLAGGRLAAHELLIVVLVTVSTPVGLIVLVRAALLRESLEGNRAALDPTDPDR
jgi:multicomponent K+:H+ antiporter subunit G